MPRKRACPFCRILAKEREGKPITKIWAQTTQWFVITSKSRGHKGHLLIIPKRHCSNFESLMPWEAADLPQALRKAIESLKDRGLLIDDYNIGVNRGTVAGQTVFHLHLHLVPRLPGDIPDPRGGIMRPFFKQFPESQFERLFP